MSQINTNTALVVIPKTKVGLKCSICLNMAVGKINKAIRKGDSLRHIAAQFAVGYRSVGRHTETCLKLDVHALLEEKRIDQAVEHYQELVKQLDFSKELQDALKSLITDSNTGKITFAPKDHEIDVLYTDYADTDILTGLPKRKKENLSEIILNIQQIRSGFSFQAVQIKTINYFETAMKSIDAVDKLLDKFAKVDGRYQKDRENDETLNRVARAFLDWLADHGKDKTLQERKAWLTRFATNSGVDALRLAERVGVEIE
ncbi:MAG: hypothetical protein H0X49_03360 [Acidobacteria bacterium]|nr:hypothetical protein [Acidobacteriota bacterium]